MAVKITLGRLSDGMTYALPFMPAKRGRPKTGKALTNAERQKRYRARHKSVDTGETMAATIKRLADQFDLTESEVTRHLLRFALCNRNWAQTGFPLSVTKKEAA